MYVITLKILQEKKPDLFSIKGHFLGEYKTNNVQKSYSAVTFTH